MTRRNILSMLAILLAGLMMSFAAPETARAQQNLNCCTYTVDIAGFPDACFRIPLWTRWSVGVFGPDLFLANGVYTFNTPTPPPCPPAATFIGASIQGPGGPYATFNNPVNFKINNCCATVRIGFDGNGCLIIYIRPC